MVFQNQAGNNVSISLTDIKDNITADEIKTAMNLIVSKNIFDSTGGSLVSPMSANVITREVQEIQVR